MKEEKLLFVTTTEYKNLSEECLVLVRNFLSHFSWRLNCNEEKADMIVKVVGDHFFVELFKTEKYEFEIEKNNLRKMIKRELYLVLARYTDKTLPWGLLQGIRPTKLVYKLYHKYQKDNQEGTISEYHQKLVDDLMDGYFLSKDMAELAVNVAQTEEKYLPSGSKANDYFSVYISIPFCPTRCHYCSFPSSPKDKWELRMEEYVNGLIHEMDEVLPWYFENKKISTVYIGGGTPTSLSKDLLEKLISYIVNKFPMDEVKEFTVEAGRPDTITKEKLEVIKKYKVNRISINPQTFNQKTLDIIGRRHTTQEVVKAYELAREVGIKRINMDLILGLPNEHLEDVIRTFKTVRQIKPSEVTVHTLAIKRSSKIHEYIENYHLPDDEETKEMLNSTRNLLTAEMNYKPYYLYRQKNMVGSYENVGYVSDGNPCIYNMEIMEEIMDIIAFGAGGITKMVDEKGKVTRIENVKNVESYLSRLDEMILRKQKYIRIDAD